MSTDIRQVCACGKSFTVTAREQERLTAKGAHLFRRCSACREKRRIKKEKSAQRVPGPALWEDVRRRG